MYCAGEADRDGDGRREAADGALDGLAGGDRGEFRPAKVLACM